jgi:hypothetical protein
MTMRRTVVSFIAIVSLAILPTFALAKSHPDATVSISAKSVAAGVGYSWGKGTLHYKGKSYPFSIDGLSVGAVGVASVTATGSVYHLKSVDDFSGQYTAVSTGAAVAGGAAVGSMKNANGVVMNLKATTRGVTLSAAVDGIKVSVEK